MIDHEAQRRHLGHPRPPFRPLPLRAPVPAPPPPRGSPRRRPEDQSLGPQAEPRVAQGVVQVDDEEGPVRAAGSRASRACGRGAAAAADATAPEPARRRRRRGLEGPAAA